jgi:diguanylate cyclase (GGDEF)-like protein/PAS domain S-box-containing protein
MINYTKRKHWALVFALLVFSTGVACSGYSVYVEYERITKRFIPNLWTAIQAEIELLRFLDALHSHARDDGAVSSEQLVTRFYVLWSRVPLLLDGEESTHVRAIDGAVPVIHALDAELEALEPVVLSLRPDDHPAHQRVHAAVEPFVVPLHRLAARTMHKDEEVADAQREDIRIQYLQLAGYLLVIIASAATLVYLLFREFSNVSGLLRVAHAAEAAASAAEARLKAVIDAVPARIAARDPQGRYILRNRYSVEWQHGALAAPGPAEDEVDRSIFETGRMVPFFEQEEISEQHGVRTWLTTKVPLEDAAGDTGGVVTVSLDISEQKEAQKLNALLATAVQHAGDAIEITDAQLSFQYVNPAFERISGFTREEAVGKTPFSLVMNDDADETYRLELQKAIASGASWQGTLTARRKNGALYQQDATVSPVRNADGEITHYVAVKRDITERLQAEARIWHLAHHDALTDLPNRVLFQDRLEHTIAQARRGNDLAAIHFIDLDHFKDVNDSLGHEVGDLLLKAVTQRLRECTREGDTVARLGGDEFGVIQFGLTSLDAAEALAKRVLARLSEPFLLDGHEVTISASIGLTLFPLDHDDPLELVKNADMAMYQAKASGRCNVRFYQKDMRENLYLRKKLERELRKAIAENQLEVFYQPQIDARRNQIVGVEALLRWSHPERGYIPPAEFIPIAEESSLIFEIGEWVLKTACMQRRDWQERGLGPIRIAVNLSAVQFLYRDLVGVVVHCLDQSGISPDQLELEITEGVLMRDTEATMTTLRRLTQLGIQIAVDDFGTGYSSMAYLKRFPVTKIKIDQAFVTDVTSDRGDAAIADAVISLAHGLGLTVAAEGVERLEQANYLRARGCDELQGFYFGRPMPASAFEQRLREIAGGRPASPLGHPAFADARALVAACA